MLPSEKACTDFGVAVASIVTIKIGEEDMVDIERYMWYMWYMDVVGSLYLCFTL